ncbi:RNA 2',3'-cyclic phosphodiesterase [Actinopolyspora mortivallis]|uniref:RNA 2',3'-cyclic phosphodiesterase n=1 Tax=Actinopolyspora mortivallis TaxID=33906 RepID=UPI000378E380|nr:RNA 2',3'-cyclic phosphodiesterase [Actinopolyspora mortivallis]
MRVFTALWPSEAAVRDLSEVLDEERTVWSALSGELRGFRFVSAGQWHLTLCFHGDEADPDEVAERLRTGVAALRESDSEFTVPGLRLAGAGTFRGVLWTGVVPGGEPETRDRTDRLLRALARTAGADPRRFRPHVTVARWARGTLDPSRIPHRLTEYTGPVWSAGELAVVASERGRGGLRYRTVHRIPLLPS